MNRVAIALLCALIAGCSGETPISVNREAPAQDLGAAPRAAYLDDTLLVMMGDSITCRWNFGPDQVDGAELISAKLANVIDMGIGGQTTAQMWARFQVDVLDKHPGTVLIEGGTNDVAKLSTDDTSYLFDMIAAAQASGARVIVGNLPPNYIDFEDSSRPALLASWRSQILNGAKTYGYEVADYFPSMLNADGTQNSALFNTDLLHPTSLGYAAMWSVLEPLLPQSVLGGTPIPTTSQGPC